MFTDGIDILVIIMGFVFLAVAWDAISNRATLFGNYLSADVKNRLLRLAIFGLLPLSIIFHELGHAIAIWSIGRSVESFGFGFIYGFVSYNAFGVSDLQSLWVSAAGTLVNIIIGVIALGIFWFRPSRPTVNYLLFVFAVIQGANALIFYPLLDFAGGIVGDWSTIYSSDTLVPSALIGVAHIGILGGSALIWKSDAFQAEYRKRTGQRVPRRGAPRQRSNLAVTLAESSSRAIAGWPHEIEQVVDAQAGGLQMILRWESDGFLRRLLIHATPADSDDPHVEMHGVIHALDPGLPQYQRPVMRINGPPNTPQLTQRIRTGLEIVESWDGSTPAGPN
ncbi:MAG: hypothetical protein ACOC9Y_08325 [Chloroflexota bacterium]